MMSEVIRQETIVFLLSVLHGVCLTLAYDLLRALRRAFAHGTAAVSAEDFLFWLAAGFLTFCLAFFYTDGVIRGYVAVGIGIGAVLYHFLFSERVVWLLSRLFLSLKWIFRMILRFLSLPLKKTCRFWQKTIEIVEKNGYNTFMKKIRGNCYGQKEKETEQR